MRLFCGVWVEDISWEENGPRIESGATWFFLVVAFELHTSQAAACEPGQGGVRVLFLYLD